MRHFPFQTFVKTKFTTVIVGKAYIHSLGLSRGRYVEVSVAVVTVHNCSSISQNEMSATSERSCDVMFPFKHL